MRAWRPPSRGVRWQSRATDEGSCRGVDVRARTQPPYFAFGVRFVQNGHDPRRRQTRPAGTVKDARDLAAHYYDEWKREGCASNGAIEREVAMDGLMALAKRGPPVLPPKRSRCSSSIGYPYGQV